MGKSVTCNYQGQVEIPGEERAEIFGAMSYQEALDKVIDEARRIKSNTGYIWPQTKTAERKIRNMSHSADYIKIRIAEGKYIEITCQVNGQELLRR